MKCVKSVLLLGCAAVLVTAAAPASAEENTRSRVNVRSTNKDRDADRDVKVSTTRTTAAYATDTRPDVVESRAEERREVEGRRWTVAPTLGAATNGLGLGVGGRVGYTFATPIYVGGNFVYHTGADENARSHAYYPSAELGYDIGLSSVLLRPYAGAGALMRGGNGNTDATGLVYPGLTAHYLLPKTPAFVGADTRVLVPFDGSASFSAAGTTGVNF